MGIIILFPAGRDCLEFYACFDGHRKTPALLDAWQ